MNTSTKLAMEKVLLHSVEGVKPQGYKNGTLSNLFKIIHSNPGLKGRVPMIFKKLAFTFFLLPFLSFHAISQIEVARVSLKNFKATGFAGFLNFSMPVSEANYLTIELGVQHFKDKVDDELSLIPFLLGYRYTISQTGTGFYLEPNAGYCYGISSIPRHDATGRQYFESDGTLAVEEVSGPMAGLGIGYLFEPSENLKFNVGLRYEHSFGKAATNLMSFRISHAFSFRRRE